MITVTFEWWQALIAVVVLAWGVKTYQVWRAAGWQSALLWPVYMMFGGAKQ